MRFQKVKSCYDGNPPRSHMEDFRRCWNSFFDNYLKEPHIPLFETNELDVIDFRRGKKNNRFLKRSPEMEEAIRIACKEIIEAHNDPDTPIDGLIYCMYTLIDESVHPLYVGKAERVGRNGGLSENINDTLQQAGLKFARWGYGYAYHIGDLSKAVFAHEGKSVPKYRRWQESLFKGSTCSLKEEVFFWCKAWNRNDVGPWKEYGPTSLSFLEYQLIGVGSKINPNMLNSEGTSFKTTS